MNGDTKKYNFAIQVKQNKYAVVYMNGLTDGETISVEAKYVSNTTAVVIVIVIVIVALIILCLICRVIKKCLC